MKVSNHNLQSILGNESHIDISSIYTSYLIYIYIHDSTHTFETYIHVERERVEKKDKTIQNKHVCVKMYLIGILTPPPSLVIAPLCSAHRQKMRPMTSMAAMAAMAMAHGDSF